MALFDVLEKKDIEELRMQIELLLASFEFSVAIMFEDGKLRATLVTRPRTAEERTAILAKLQVAR